jgi:hypothetical protein
MRLRNVPAALLCLLSCVCALNSASFAQNTPPTLTSVNTINFAREDSVFYVEGSSLFNNADEADADGDALTFRIEEILVGTLKRSDGTTAVVPGESTVAFNQALAWTPPANANGIIGAFTVVAFDGTDVSSPPVTVNINVAPFDDTPTLDPIANQTIDEDSMLTLTLTGITSGAANEDQPLSVSATVKGVTGAPTASVTTSIDYTSPQNTALLHLTPAPNSYGAVMVTVTVSDGHTPSPNYPRTDTRSFYLDVRPVNDAPTLDAIPDLTINEDSGPVTVNLNGITSGAPNENQTLSLRSSINYPPYLLTSSTIPITYTSPQSTGTLTLNLIANAHGSAPITVSVTDGMNSISRTFNLTIVPVNDAPTLTTMLPLRSTNEDQPYTVVFNALTFEGNEADVDGPSMNFRIEELLIGTMTQNGQPIVPGQTLVNANQSVVWTPPANQHGDIPAFTVRAWDTIDASTTPVTVAVRVNSVNDYPYAAGNQALAVVEDTPTKLPLPATDADGQAVTYVFSGLQTGSSVTGTAPNLMYNPPPNLTGYTQFAYTASDGTLTSYGSFVANISPVNDAPTLTLVNPLKGGSEDYTYTASHDFLTFEGNEADVDGPSISFRVEEVVVGTLTQNGQPVVLGETLIRPHAPVVWTPPANANGNIVAFRVRAYDGSLASANAVDVPIALAPVNDAPVTKDSTSDGTEDTPLPLTLNATDVDGDVLSYEFVELNGASISGTAPNFVYNPVPNRNGQASFYFRVNDGKVYSGFARVTINLAPAPDAPTLTAVAPFTQGKEDTAFYISHYGLWQNANEYQPEYPSDQQPILSFRVEEVLSGTLTKGGQPVVPGQTILAQSDANYPLVWTPPANANGTINAFTVKAWDGTNASATAVPVPIVVAAANDAPSVQNPSVTTNEDAAVDFTIEASDADDDALTYAIAQQPPASVGAIRGNGPSFTFTPAANFNGTAGFSFRVSDGTATVFREGNFISVTPVNDAPTLTNINTIPNAIQGRPITVSLQQLRAFSNVADIDNATDSVRFRVESIESGTLTSNGATVQTGFLIDDGDDVIWTPAADALGETTAFTVKAWDGNLASSTAVPVKFEVAASNNAPQGQAQTIALNEDASAEITLFATDADGEALTYSIYVPPAKGTLSGTAPNVTYTPNANYNGNDRFFFQANDGKVNSAPVEISITVNSVNDEPTISRIDVTPGTEDTGIGFPAHVLIGKTDGADVDGNPVYLKVESLGAGKLQIANVDATVGRPIYPNDYLYWTPPANATGLVTIANLRAFDGSLASSQVVPWQTDLTPVNDGPTAQGLAAYKSEDTPHSGTLVGKDVDNDPLTFRITQAPQHGTLSGTLPAFTYTPDANYVGDDSFQFVTNDGQLDSAPATILFHFRAQNDAPTLTQVNDLTGALEDSPFEIAFATLAEAANEADVDNDAIAFRIESIEAGTLTKNGVAVRAGTIFNAGETLIWKAPTDANGTDTAFSIKAWDGTLASATAIPVQIAVENTSDVPTAQNQSVNTSEDEPVGITLSAQDIDGDALTYSVVAQPQHGTLTGTAPNLTYTPDANYNGEDSFTFQANDGALDSNIATVTIAIAAKNDAPVAYNQGLTTNEDQAKAILLGASDADGDALTFSIVAAPQHGTISGSGANRTYTPNANYSGPDIFTYRVNDGTTDSNTATISIIVASVNDVPVASGQAASTTEDTAKAIALSANDSDGETLSYTIVSQPQQGTLSGTAPNLIYTPNANYNGSDSFSFKANDGSADSNVATVSISISAVNDAPTLTTINALSGGLEDTAFTISFATLAGAANAADVEGNALSFRIESAQTGTLTKNGVAVTAGTLLSAGESLSWKAAANANGTLNAFGVKAWDGALASSDEISVKVNVAGVNDAPGFSLSGTSLTVKKNAAAQAHAGWATNITAGPADESAQTKTFVVTNSNTVLFSAQPAISSNGTLTFTPAKNKTGTATVTVKLQDSGGTANGGLNTSTTQTFTIRIG